MSALLEHTAVPTENERRLASESSEVVGSASELLHDVSLQFLDDDAPHDTISLPPAALRLLAGILKEMAKGNSISVLPTNAMLTTQQAADILNVSRPFLVGLLEAGRLPYQRLGSHRRILLTDLITFKNKIDADREDAMRQMTQDAQELSLGY